MPAMNAPFVRASLGVCAGLLLAAAPAAAQPMPIAMDRVTDDSRLGLELGIVSIDDDGLFQDDLFAARFDLSGHMVTIDGFGGYASIVGVTTLGAEDDESALQALEVGGLFRLQSQSADWWLRGGLLLDTAADDLGGIIANSLAATARLTDIAKIAPDTTWLRLSTTPIIHSGNVIFRFDLGLDIPIDDDGNDLDTLLRANFGLGFMAGATALLVELVNTGDLDDDDGDDDFLHTLSFGARFLQGPVEPHIALGIPLDDDVRDFAPFFLLFGMSAQI